MFKKINGKKNVALKDNYEKVHEVYKSDTQFREPHAMMIFLTSNSK